MTPQISNQIDPAVVEALRLEGGLCLFPVGLSDPDCKANGQQELSGEEPGGSGDPRLNVDHLLRQDGHPHPEPNDGRPHVVRQSHRGSGHQRRPVK